MDTLFQSLTKEEDAHLVPRDMLMDQVKKVKDAESD